MEMMQDLQLPDAPEPIALKVQTIEERFKNPTWDSDSLRAWYGNKLPSYLWTDCGWGSCLNREGVTWQGFLECLSAWKRDINRWLRSELSWDDLVSDIRQTIPRFKPWLDARHGHVSSSYFPLRAR